MQKIYKVFLSLIIFCIVSVMIPFNISASASYVEFTSNWINLGNNGLSDHYVYSTVPGVRLVRIGTSSTVNSVYAIYTDVFRVSSSVYAQTVNDPTLTNNASSYTNVDNIRYYYRYITSWVSDGYPTTQIPYFHSDVDGENVTNRNLAYNYTFGDGAVPDLNYGELIVGFHTNFSASGTTNNYTITSNTNLDTIEWKNVDSNGNDLQNKGLNVQIRAVPILYSASSKNALDLLGFQDAVVNYNDGLILWTGNFNDNHKSFIWNDVINQLQTSNPAFALTSLLTGSVWTRYGWIYQIRYNDVLNNYSSEWQTIYNSTSITVSDSEKIVNQYYYTYPSGVGSDDQDIFHDINTVNNTNNTWYVNEVPVDPDASWLDALIQAIAEILGKILDFFSSIFDGLVDLILGLFGDINPAENFFNWFSNLFNGIGDIDLTLPQFNLPNADLTSFNRLVQETLDIFSFNNFGFVIFIPLLLIIIKAVF